MMQRNKKEGVKMQDNKMVAKQQTNKQTSTQRFVEIKREKKVHAKVKNEKQTKAIHETKVFKKD